MKKTFTIAHLSDLHLSPDFFPERSRHFRSILSFCKQRQVDHIIITGDITNQAKENEFDHFRKILREFSLLDSKKITVINGNHDIFGGPYYAEDVLSFPTACKSTDYAEKMDQFYRYTKETFTSTKFFSEKSFFPFLKVVGDIAIVGLNSVAEWHAVKNPIGSNGKINSEQFKSLRELLNCEEIKKKKIFIAIHHHFSAKSDVDHSSTMERIWSAVESATLKLRKKKRLLKLFTKANVAKVLHGHVHHHGMYKKEGITFVNAGATIVPAKNSQQAFHFINVREECIETENIVIPAQLKSYQKKEIPLRNIRKSLAIA
ncbi:MAG: metallophosphoesterase [Bacteroidota bacterium]|nr:metallophosphoesterase [Bacteroidota bacterium]